jgi:hypothetical protein
MGLVTADLLLTSGTSSLTIHNPDALIDGGVPSGGINFSVENPKPSISRVSPKVVLAGSTDTIIHVYGNNFVSGAAVNWNGAALATSFISRKQVDAVIPSAQLTTQLKAAITVTNPVPGGGTSKKMWLIIR